ncbi:MAG: hypothetical protein H7Y20_03085 [Bryobacteraceae bacterium]|nr:hypothetical protein [Bryobacteraceae bacterium]
MRTPRNCNDFLKQFGSEVFRSLITRRSLFSLLPSFCLGAFFPALAPGASPLDRIAANWPAQFTGPRTRRYRADVIVTFLGIPVFSRASVGSANITVEEGTTQDNAQTVALRFAAGSVPERTKGLNRLGYIQELVVCRNTDVLESAYFGFMTSSPESNYDEDRKALGPDAKDAVAYTAVQGSAVRSKCSYELYQMVLPGTWTFAHCDEVVRHVRASLSRKELKLTRAETSADLQSPRTFLYAVREAIQSGSKRIQTPFLYNGKPFKLDVEKGPDPKTAQHFVSKKLVASASSVLRLNGSIQNLQSGDKTPFRVWFEKDSDLPLRFEYRPRGYLNLAFEQYES